ncbi:MAG: enoyl-CoA hydratase/isomerase family protein [Burkholderiaceae bacterium]
MAAAVQTEIDGALAIVRLNRPHRLNAVDAALRSGLREVLPALNRDDAVRAIVLTGAGDRAFCAGQDLDEAAALEWQQIVPWLRAQHAMYQAVRDLDKPCVAALNGVAAGAGFQIALCADWRVAARDTRIGQPEIKAGLASIVGSYLMTLQVGLTHNIGLSLTGELVSGQRAYEIGLVSELADDGEVLAAAVARARQMAALPATPMRVSKQRFRELSQPGFDAALAAAVRAQLECYAQGDPQRAMEAFAARRRSG